MFGSVLCWVVEFGYVYLMILWGLLGCGKIMLVLLLVYYVDVEFWVILVVLFGLLEVC